MVHHAGDKMPDEFVKMAHLSPIVLFITVLMSTISSTIAGDFDASSNLFGIEQFNLTLALISHT